MLHNDEFSSDRIFVENQSPVVIKGAEQFMKKPITPDVLLTKLPDTLILDGEIVRSRSNNIFYRINNKPMSKFSIFQNEMGTSTLRNVNAKELFDFLTNQSDMCSSQDDIDNYFHYYTAGNKSSMTKAIHNFLDIESLLPKKVDGERSYNSYISGKSVTYWCHYDATFNLHLQIYGQKTVLLLHPSLVAQLELQSFLSPLFRRTQLDIGNHEILQSLTQLSSIGHIQQITLHPGDLLYIPPFWFHHITAKSDVSIATSIFIQPPAVKDLYQEMSLNASIFLQMNRFPNNKTPKLQYQAALLERLWERIVSNVYNISRDSARSWIRKLAISRWTRTIKHYPKSISLFATFCSPATKHDRSTLADIASRIILRNTLIADNYYDTWISKMSAIFHDLPVGGTDIELGHLLESTIYDVFRSPMSVGSFLWNCFHS